MAPPGRTRGSVRVVWSPSQVDEFTTFAAKVPGGEATKPTHDARFAKGAAVHALRGDARPLRLPHMASTANRAASAGILLLFHAIGASRAPPMTVWFRVSNSWIPGPQPGVPGADVCRLRARYGSGRAVPCRVALRLPCSGGSFPELLLGIFVPLSWQPPLGPAGRDRSRRLAV